jgi:hypothetical protein
MRLLSWHQDRKRGNDVKSVQLFAAVAFISACLQCVATLAGEPAATDPQVGKWELQPASSHFCKPEAAPQKSVREIFDVGGHIYLNHWTGIDAKGKPIDYLYIARYDNRKYAFPAASWDPLVYMSWKRISTSKVSFLDWSKVGKVIAENTRTVSPDGRTMVQATTAIDASGRKSSCTDTQVFAKQ